MNISTIKQHIYDNNLITTVLEELGMKAIKSHDNGRYITTAYPDGDNANACVIFTDNSYFNVNSYTREIKDKYNNSDLMALICFIKNCYFYEGLKWLCDVVGLDYYHDDDLDIPESLRWTRMMKEMVVDSQLKTDEPLKPIDIKILKYYHPWVNDMFKNDGIDYYVQQLFNIGYDDYSNRITIPIYDEISNLVGVKGRLFKEEIEPWENKYMYLEPCSKSKILYGLHITMPFIIKKKVVYVVESEKSVLQMYSHGIFNCVAIGGHDISKTQIEKLIRLGVDEIIFCYDQDVARMENGKVDMNWYYELSNMFIQGIAISALIDVNNTILNEKESPSDDFAKFKILESNKITLRM